MGGCCYALRVFALWLALAQLGAGAPAPATLGSYPKLTLLKAPEWLQPGAEASAEVASPAIYQKLTALRPYDPPAYEKLSLLKAY